MATLHPHPFGSLVTGEEHLRQIVPPPSQLVLNKVIDHLDVHARALLALTPYVVLATTDAAGRCDSSPRGGEPGFIRVLDDKHFLIPEVTGNRRNDSILNLLESPCIGLLVLVPGFDETLRINGRAWVTEDKELLSESAHAGKLPLLGIGVRVEECYMHCAKASLRSTLWNPLGWAHPAELPDPAEILRDHTGGNEGDGSVKHMTEVLRESYTERLY
jgi:PPOX class probable FMN-dependent enzyme